MEKKYYKGIKIGDTHYILYEEGVVKEKVDDAIESLTMFAVATCEVLAYAGLIYAVRKLYF